MNIKDIIVIVVVIFAIIMVINIMENNTKNNSSQLELRNKELTNKLSDITKQRDECFETISNMIDEQKEEN